MPTKPSFLSQPGATTSSSSGPGDLVGRPPSPGAGPGDLTRMSGSGGATGPGDLTKTEPQKTGIPDDIDKDSIREGGRTKVPDRSKYNEASTAKPWKNLGDGGKGGGPGSIPGDVE